MKKLLTLLLVSAMVLCLASCQYLPDSFQSAIDNVMGIFGGETACEHEWTDATCTAPKTCSLCGETDGEANGHTEEIVAGTAATCTESGMTDGKKCSVCGVITVEQTVIAALGHTEETVAGTPATCTEAGMTDGKKCSVCGVTTVEQTAIKALDHKAGEDDGDVTTAVTCERCDFVFVEAKEAITLTIPAFENGAVVADKMNYAIGDTVKLTVNPEWNYAQKLYINDEPLMLNWNDNVYSFVAEKDTYVISGSFEPTREMHAGDPTRWDNINQAHGVITAYYPNDNDAWWYKIDGNYTSFAITAKNYRDIENSYEGGPDGGWRIALYMQLDNGNYYAFSMWIDTNKVYAYNHFGGNVDGVASTTGWRGAWCLLSDKNAEATAALNGDGAEFKLERIDGNHIQITFGGVVLETYEIPDVTADNKVISVGLLHYGNKGAYVDIPFALTDACDHTWVDATCTAPKTCSKCNVEVGEKLEHTPADAVKENEVDATCKAEGSYESVIKCSICSAEISRTPVTVEKLDHTEETVAGKDATCTATGLTDGKKCTVCGEITVPQTEIPVKSHKDEDKNYKCDDCEANLCTDHVEEIVVGKNATCTEAGLTDGKKCSICGQIITAQEVINALGHKASEDDGSCATAVVCANGCGYIFVEAMNHDPEADDGDVTTAVKCANAGCEQIVVPAKEAITLTIPTFENGAVTADKKNYAIGDTVTLTIDPADGYAQKLYIDGNAILVDTNSKYSFVAEKDSYVIGGTFEQNLSLKPYDAGRWDTINHAHGVISTQYNAGDHNKESWWFDFNGEYSAISVVAKNYLPLEDSKDGNGNTGFSVVLRISLDNGKSYSFRIINDKGEYAVQEFGGNWGYWTRLDVDAAKALNGDGVDFKLEREGNVLKVSVNGKVYITYTMEGVTADNKVTSVSLRHYGNPNMMVEIPFALTVPTVEEEPPVSDDVTLTMGEFTNGTVTADKESYKVGDTITLTLAPNAGHFQQLYINGEPLILDWKTKVYSFVAEENKYEITGNFVKEYSMNVYDWGRWDNHDQAHGVITTYYPGQKDSWWMNFNGEYESIAVTVKNHMPQESSPNFSHVLRMTIGGKFYAFRIFAENGIYVYGRFGSGEGKATTGMEGDWSGWKDLSHLSSDINGDGVVFKITRTGANVLTITIDDVVVDTYTIAGVTADDKVESVGMIHYGNAGEYVEIPFELN